MCYNSLLNAVYENNAMAETLVGLDIGDYSAKVVEILKKGRQTRLLACGLKVIPKGAELEGWLNCLKELYKDAGVSNTRVNSSVAGKDVVTRYAVFPPLTKKALIRSLKFEFDKYIPFPLNECFVDLDILEKRQDGKINVLIVSAKKYRIDERSRLIRGAGLMPKTITIDSLALYKGFCESPFFSKDNSSVLLNMGHSTTNLLIIRKGILIFSRDINLGGENFTRSIADRLDVPAGKAEELKYNPQDTSLLEALSIDLDYLINEIELSIEYSRWNYDLESIQCIYLSGGSSKFTGLNKILENKLKAKIDFWNPFIGLKKTRDFPALEENYQELALSLGIALT